MKGISVAKHLPGCKGWSRLLSFTGTKKTQFLENLLKVRS